VVVDELYYGPQGTPPEDAAALPIDLSKAVQRALKRIYRKKINPEREIDPGIWKGIVDTIDLAAAEGLKQYPAASYDFKRQLLHNDQVFAAFKVHRLQGDMARQMVDAQGNIKSFEQWVKDVQPIALHQCRQWLRTEYDTAVKRASLASDWQRFEDEKDVLPNLRWVPSTAANPDSFHQSMWDTVLPVDHPFWSSHHPGDRWGCQCSLEATDDPVTPSPTVNYATSPGLENNPGRDAKLFNDTHPYFPDSCDSCPFRGGHASGPTNLAKDCYHCQYADSALPGKKEEAFTPDPEYGERLLTSSIADQTEVKENARCARSILDSFPEDRIQIRGHSTEPGVKNPEYLINNILADRKGILKYKGVRNGFQSAIDQGARIVVFDLDKNLSGYPLKTGDLAKRISWRYSDFENGIIDACYVVYQGKAVRILKDDVISKEAVERVLQKLKP